MLNKLLIVLVGVIAVGVGILATFEMSDRLQNFQEQSEQTEQNLQAQSRYNELKMKEKQLMDEIKQNEGYSYCYIRFYDKDTGEPLPYELTSALSIYRNMDECVKDFFPEEYNQLNEISSEMNELLLEYELEG